MDPGIVTILYTFTRKKNITKRETTDLEDALRIIIHDIDDKLLFEKKIIKDKAVDIYILYPKEKYNSTKLTKVARKIAKEYNNYQINDIGLIYVSLTSGNKKTTKKKTIKLPKLDRESGVSAEYHVECKFGIAEKKNNELVAIKKINKDEEAAIIDFLDHRTYDATFRPDSIEKGIVHLVGEIHSNMNMDEDEVMKEVERLIVNLPIKTEGRILYLY